MCFLKKVERIMEVVKSSVLDKLKSEAEKEIQAEFESRAKEKIKGKLRDLEVAKKVVANMQRELEDLYVELSS